MGRSMRSDCRGHWLNIGSLCGSFHHWRRYPFAPGTLDGIWMVHAIQRPGRRAVRRSSWRYGIARRPGARTDRDRFTVPGRWLPPKGRYCRRWGNRSGLDVTDRAPNLPLRHAAYCSHEWFDSDGVSALFYNLLSARAVWKRP